MTDLDDLKEIEKYDKSRMLELLESFPEQCSRAKAIGEAFDLPGDLKARRYKNIVFTGVGGSAIGLDLVRSYASDKAGAPILVNRNYKLPNFVDSDSLVIVSSYSGDTEETLSAYDDARLKRATSIAITSDGELQRLAQVDKVPLITIPKGLPPRCGLGYSFFPLLILLSKLNVIEDKSKEISLTIELLKELLKSIGQKRSSDENIAKQIAKAVHLKMPIIYGGQDRIDSVVVRWRNQFAENSKTLSSSHVFPEMNHNEIVGWENPNELLKNCIVIILRDADDHPRTSKRMEITKKILEDFGVKVIEVNSIGKGILSRIFSLIYIGDFVSYYLAILNGCDPTPVERVVYLKRELAKG